MSENFLSLLLLFPAGVIAGILSTVTGLASLVSYPSLLMVGLMPVSANVTNTAALILTGLGSVFSSKKELASDRQEIIKIVPAALLGSVFGSLLLLEQPASEFAKVVPFFIFAAGLLLLFRKKRTVSVTVLDKETDPAAPATSNQEMSSFFKILFFIAIFFTGAYAGYFGAAAGVVMLAILSFISDKSFPVYNALRNLSIGLCNLIATVIFAFSGKINWLMVIPLGAGLFLGGYIGPKIVRKIPAHFLKIVVAIGAFCLAIVLFLEAWV